MTRGTDMLIRTPRRLNTASAIMGLAVLATVAAASPSMAAGSASIAGSWAGSGTLRLDEGNEEKVRCRVTYGRIAGQEFSLSARCATSSNALDQTGQLKRVSENQYVGDIHNRQFNLSARVTVTVSGSQQVVAISSSHGSASLNLKRR